jgi:hypothetical protein
LYANTHPDVFRTFDKKGDTMKIVTAAFALSSALAVMGGSAIMPTVANAAAERNYVACNQSGDCWRVHERYAYGEAAPVTYYNSDWYDSHRNDPNIHWRADPDNDRGYYERGGTWHSDPAARAVRVGATGAGVGAAIGCLVTLPIGCAPGAAAGAAIGGGTGAVAGAATTPRQ